MHQRDICKNQERHKDPNSRPNMQNQATRFNLYTSSIMTGGNQRSFIGVPFCIKG